MSVVRGATITRVTSSCVLNLTSLYNLRSQVVDFDPANVAKILHKKKQRAHDLLFLAIIETAS